MTLFKFCKSIRIGYLIHRFYEFLFLFTKQQIVFHQVHVPCTCSCRSQQQVRSPHCDENVHVCALIQYCVSSTQCAPTCKLHVHVRVHVYILKAKLYTQSCTCRSALAFACKLSNKQPREIKLLETSPVIECKK